jgi:hypothetical protein
VVVPPYVLQQFRLKLLLCFCGIVGLEKILVALWLRGDVYEPDAVTAIV